MIKLEDLNRIKDIFSKIAFNSTDRKLLTVKFNPIDINKFEITMSNGVDFARIIINESLGTLAFSISWFDFLELYNFFQLGFEPIVKDNLVCFREKTTKYKCTLKKETSLDEVMNFKFNFENAKLISMDNCIILKDLGSFNNFAMGKGKLISCDGNFAIINDLKQTENMEVYTFTEKIPQGTWYFNPDFRLIVSEDKTVACTYRKGLVNYPFDTLLKFSEQYLNNWFEVDLKDFKNKIDQCKKVSEVIRLNIKDDNIILQAISEDNHRDFKTEISAVFEHKTPKETIKFGYKYLALFCNSKNEKLKIYFDDNLTEYKLSIKDKNYCMFGLGMI